MCARRFLMLIFILTLIFVGGAFALYQFGDQVLVRMATPSGHYQEPAKGQRAGLFEGMKAGLQSQAMARRSVALGRRKA